MAVRVTTQPAQPVSTAIVLPSSVPLLPDEVVKRFPGVEEYQEQMKTWWKKVRANLSTATDTLATATNESKAVEKDLDTKITTVSAEFSSDIATAMAAISTETTIRANADGALASQITTVQAAYETADATMAASIVTETTARSNADGALATQITTLTTAYQAADSTIAASVTTEITARSNADGALATSITNLTTAYQSADTAIAATVTSEATARSNADGSLASQITTLTTAYQGADSTLQSNITAEITARSNADTALANRTTTLESQVQTAGTGLLARMSTVETTYATQTFAEAKKTEAITAAVATANGNAAAYVSTEASARATADGHLSSKWTLQIGAGGAVAGINLSSSTDGGTNVSSFRVSAAIFEIYNDVAGTGTAPFFVTGGNTYIQDAFIKNVAAEKIEAGTINVAIELTAAIFSAGKVATGATRFNLANYAKEMPFVSYAFANIITEFGEPITPLNTSTTGTYFTSANLEMPGWGTGADGIVVKRFGLTDTFFQVTLDGSCDIPTGRMGYDLVYRINGGGWNNFSAHHVARDSAFENIALVTSVLITGLAGTDVVQFGVKIDHSSGAVGAGIGELYISVVSLNG